MPKKKQGTPKGNHYKGYYNRGAAKNPFKYNLTRALFGGFPEKASTKLRYCQTVSVNPSAGAVTAYSFRANSLFDSDQSGTGHQAQGFDRWAGVYNHYLVYKARMRATFHPVNAGVASSIFGIRLDDDGSSSSLLATDYVESGGSCYKIQPDNYTIQHPHTLTKWFDAKKWFGVKDMADNKQDLGAQVTTNPSDVCSFVLFVGPADESTDMGAWQITVLIDYFVEFTEPKDQTQN